MTEEQTQEQTPFQKGWAAAHARVASGSRELPDYDEYTAMFDEAGLTHDFSNESTEEFLFGFAEVWNKLVGPAPGPAMHPELN